MTLARLPYFHDGSPSRWWQPGGESWQGGASGSGDLIVPGKSGVGGPALGMWLYVPSSWLSGSGFGGFAGPSFSVLVWTAGSTDPVGQPSWSSFLWIGYEHDYGAFSLYYDFYSPAGSGGTTTLVPFWVPSGNIPGDTWMWLTVSINAAPTSGLINVRGTLTPSGSTFPTYDRNLRMIYPTDPTASPSSSDLALSGTLGLFSGTYPAQGGYTNQPPPNTSGILMSRVHYLPHYCSPSASVPPALSPLSPPRTHITTTGASGERIYNPDGRAATAQSSLPDSSGTGLDLATTSTNGLILSATAPA